MNTLKQTTVRVNLSNDFEVKATLKGLQFGNNVITWNWPNPCWPRPHARPCSADR